MKRFLAAVAVVGALALAGSAQAQTRVIQTAPSGGIDANTLALLAATGALGTSGGASALLPFLLQQNTGQTIVVDEGRRRGGYWRPRGPRPVTPVPPAPGGGSGVGTLSKKNW